MVFLFFDFLIFFSSGFKEVDVRGGKAASTSSSLLREMGKREEFVRGSNRHVPFLPGGVDEEDGEMEEESVVFDEGENGGYFRFFSSCF